MTRRGLGAAGASIVVSLGVALLVGEFVVRHAGRSDEDGNFYLGGRRIRPYRLPQASVERKLQEYRATPDSYTMFDAFLGWTDRPNAKSRDGLYETNAQGLRADRNFDAAPPPGVLRVELFGDSFIHGHDVPLPGSIAPQLEEALRRRGVDSEVLNFGVGGYGIDQAYLRYRRAGADFAPAVVVMGLQLENIARDVNLFRPFYFRDSGIPFTKPRFLLDERGLRLINSPTVPIDRIPTFLAEFPDSLLSRYEHYFHADDHRWFFYRHSRLLATLVDSLRDRFRPALGSWEPLAPGSEATRLTVAILERFRDEVEARRGRFILVYLPLQAEIAESIAGRRDPNEEMLEVFRRRFRLVDPSGLFREAGRREPIENLIRSHYTPEGYGLVAEALARELTSAAPRARSAN